MNLKNAKILIINGGHTFAHAGGKLNKTLAEEMKNYLEEKGHEVKITHIEEGYKPDKENATIMWSDVVILQTPAWWMGLPWPTKKYIDEVFSQKVLYRNDGRTRSDPSKKYGSGGNCHGKHFMISSTWNAPEEAFNEENQFFEGRKAEGVWFNVYKAWEYCGFTRIPPVTFNNVMKVPNFEKYIKDLHAHLDKYF